MSGREQPNDPDLNPSPLPKVMAVAEEQKRRQRPARTPVGLSAKEARQLEYEQRKLFNERRNELLLHQALDLVNNRWLRKFCCYCAFGYLIFLTILVFLLLLFDGASGNEFSISPIVLSTLVGGTMASAIGIPAGIVYGLFKSDRETIKLLRDSE